MKIVLHLVSGLAVAAALAALASAGAAASGGQSFRSATNLVALNVTVQDAGSRYVAGLSSPDFAVYEDGVQQDVRFFEAASIPIDLIVLLDTSLSMSPRIEVAQAAARGFLDTLRPGDRGAVVTFSDRVAVTQELTPDRAALTSAVHVARTRGNTALYMALYVALKHFGLAVKSETSVRRQALVVLSDGEDTASLLSFDDILPIARQTGVSIYTVRLGSRSQIDRLGNPGPAQFFSAADFDMKRLARETGALSFFPAPSELPAVYASIAQELASQYSIGYEPANRDDRGRFHQVTVRIVSRPELRARTRAGYTTDVVVNQGAGPR